MSLQIVLLISADAEWRSWLELNHGCFLNETPFGECFEHTITGYSILSMYSGWGKVSAASSTQWAIDHHHPKLIINLGTCGGLEGRIQRNAIILVERTRIYDIHEQMTDPEEAECYYATTINLSWLGNQQLPDGVARETMFSADRDIIPKDIPLLINHYSARVADWESGAIAWVAARYNTPLLILRGVSDLVSQAGGESYANVGLFQNNTRKIMATLAGQLPWWLQAFDHANGFTSPV